MPWKRRYRVTSLFVVALLLLPAGAQAQDLAAAAAREKERRKAIGKSAPTITEPDLALGHPTESVSATPTVEAAAAIAPGFNWFPGYYVLSSSSNPTQKQRIVDDPLVAPFHGVQFRYNWVESELAPGNYSAGFAALDADLQRVAAKSKKLLVMLQYKKFDGTPAVPADLRTSPGPWCSGSYCGQLTTNRSSLALLWNAAVEARLKAWISAMAAHLAASPYLANVAGIVFNETSLGTKDITVLTAAKYDPNVYLQAIEDNLLAATTAAPKLVAFIYFEGGFVSMNGSSVKAGENLGDWILMHPRTGAGMADLAPKDPKASNHPCANPRLQGRIPCEPAVEGSDYALTATDSLDQTFRYAMSPAPTGVLSSFITFSYKVGTGPNAFTFADVSNYIKTHPMQNANPPTW